MATLPWWRGTSSSAPRVATSSAALAFQKRTTTTLPARISRTIGPSRRPPACLAGLAAAAGVAACGAGAAVAGAAVAGAAVAGVAGALVPPVAAWTFALAASDTAAAAFAFGIAVVGASGVSLTDTLGFGRRA